MAPLTARELDRLAQAQRVLLSPFEHPDPEGWMHAAGSELKGLFEADLVVFTLGSADAEHLASPEVGPEALEEYAQDFVRDDLAGNLVAALPHGYYVEEDFYLNPTFQRHLASAVYNEWYRKHRLTDAIGLFAHGSPHYVPDLYAGLEAPLVANVLLAGSGRCRGEGAEGARTMLALLQPALAVSVRMWQQAASSTGHLTAALDTLAVALWLFCADGQCVHESPAAGALMRRRPKGEALRVSARRLAGAMLRGRQAGLPVPTAERVVLGGESVLLTGTYLPQESRTAPAVLIRAEGGGVQLPSEEEVRGRFGLTPQEARVALLRARGEGTAAVAEQLGISVHTARRHTERVMEKLGVRRVAEIGPCLLALREAG